jgi:two-component system, OmpR family, response regulator
MKVLIVEDDPKISTFVSQGLKQAGFHVDQALDGEEGFRYLSAHEYDAAIVDLMLPKKDGMAMIEEMRNRKITVPVIILSAKRSLDDRVRGLQMGGDDYLTKPFAFSELLARVQALIRRAGTKATQPVTQLTSHNISMDLLSREVFRGEEAIPLQPREFSLLEYMMRNPGRVLSKTMILEHVWDYNFDPQTNVVDVLICRLRNKIDRNFEPKVIQTIRGVGYVLRSA